MATKTILLLSRHLDYTTDYISLLLSEASVNYIRLNLEDFDTYEIGLDPIAQRLQCIVDGKEWILNVTDLWSVFFRCPTHLRHISNSLEYSSRIQRFQWTEFIRCLQIFSGAFWVNYPQAVYLAENKAIQLLEAKRIGFNLPATLISNSSNLILKHLNDQEFALKSLEAITSDANGKPAFVYTNKLHREFLAQESVNFLPGIYQTWFDDKLDIRVTIIGDTVYAAEIRHEGERIEGDWRLKGKQTEFVAHKLPDKIKDKCIELTRKLNLKFAAIDLVLQRNNYYFLEVNPTGEWAWLVDGLSFRIDLDITNALIRGYDQ